MLYSTTTDKGELKLHSKNNMPRRTRQGYEMHSRTQEYKKRIKEAEKNVETILSSEYNPILEYSGGKDSLVLLHLFMQQNDDLPVYNYHPGYGRHSKQLYRSQEVHQELLEAARIAGAKDLTVVNTPFCRENYLIGDYFDLLFKLMKEKECNLEILGIRGEESITRKHRVKGKLIKKEGQRLVCFPIRHLTVDDIWAYILTNDLFYVTHYDKFGPIYGWDKVRFTSHFNENEVELGGNYFFDRIVYPNDVNTVLDGSEYWQKDLKQKKGDWR